MGRGRAYWRVYPWMRAVLLMLHLRDGIGNARDFLFLNADKVFHVTLPGLDFLNQDVLMFGVAWATVICALAAIFNIKPAVTGLASGLLGLVVMAASTESRLVMGYYPTFAVLALALTELQRDAGPVILFLTAAYLIPGLHKLAHWNQMIEYVPADLAAVFAPYWAAYPATVLDALTRIMVWTAVPAELTIAALVAFARTRRLGFMCAFVFHSLLTLSLGGANMLASVGVMLLSTHIAAATYSPALDWRSVFGGRRGWCAAGVILCAGGADYLWVDFPQAQGLCVILWLFTPFMLASWRANFSHHVRWRGQWPQWIMALLLVLWALTPVAMDYQNDHLGMAMFSGANRQSPWVHRWMRDDSCVTSLQLNPLFTVSRDHGLVDVATRQPAALRELDAYLSRRCPAVLNVSPQSQ